MAEHALISGEDLCLRERTVIDTSTQKTPGTSQSTEQEHISDQGGTEDRVPEHTQI